MFRWFLLFASVVVLIVGSGGGENKKISSHADVKGSSIKITSSPTPTILKYILITQTPTPTQIPSPTPIPTITPLPTNIPVSSSEIEAFLGKYGEMYGVDKGLLVKIAYCESKHNPSARAGDYGGLFQFSTSLWISTRNTMSLDTNPDLRFHPEESIKTAAYKISAGGLSSWPNCSR